MSVIEEMPVTTKIEAHCKFGVGPEDSTLNTLFTRFDTWCAMGVLRVYLGSDCGSDDYILRRRLSPLQTLNLKSPETIDDPEQTSTPRSLV